jgi:hypothetical protein
MLPLYRFNVINGNMKPDTLQLCRIVGAQWQRAWQPGNTFVVDESVYEYLGESPCHVYIPRKPHPNGIMSYGLAGYTSVLKMPMLLDLEPWVPSNKLSARDSAKALAARTRAAHPTLALHLVMDSAFGSFADVSYYHSRGVVVTMSMTENKKPWLWGLLGYRCPLDSGRAALLPMDAPGHHLLASLYHVKSDSGKLIDIRTVTSAFAYTAPETVDEVVASIGQRRKSQNGFFEYETIWADGTTTWQQAGSFMDMDGTFNMIWLQQARAEDVEAALLDVDLEALCDHQSWKVGLLSHSHAQINNYLENWHQKEAYFANYQEDARDSRPHRDSD